MTSLLDKIRSRGYWWFVIRPSPFQEKRVNYDDLLPIVRKATVDIGGWDIPFIDDKTEIHRDVEWLGQESEWSEYLEIWRIYQSGQFLDIFGMQEDWRDQSHWSKPQEGWRPGFHLSVVQTVIRITGIFELAARLSLTEAGDESVHIEVILRGLQGRQLVMDDPRRWWSPSRVRKATILEFPYRVELPRTDLIANPAELALTPTLELFRRFGWDTQADILRDIQVKAGRR